MAFKIVGADENSDFPERVETRLAEKFTSETYVDTKTAAAQSSAVTTANSYTDTAISNIQLPGGIAEDPSDPGFFI